MPAAYIQMHLRLDFFKETNPMNPGQTAPKAAVWSGFCNIGYLRTLAIETADYRLFFVAGYLSFFKKEYINPL